MPNPTPSVSRRRKSESVSAARGVACVKGHESPTEVTFCGECGERFGFTKCAKGHAMSAWKDRSGERCPIRSHSRLKGRLVAE